MATTSHTAAATASRADAGDFDALVASQRSLLLAYVKPIVGWSQVDPEDALQEGLTRLWREHSRTPLPSEPAKRQAHVLRALRLAAISAIRHHHGEGDSIRRRTVSADLQLAESRDTDRDELGGGVASTHAAVGRALFDQANGQGLDDAAVQRHVLVEALAQLDELEARVIFGISEGADYRELAEELGVTVSQVNNAANRARSLLVGLIAHAGRIELEQDEREQLLAFLGGLIADPRKRRAAQRHVRACKLCRRVAELERGVERIGVRIFVPLPLLFTATTKAAAASGGGAAAIVGSAASTAPGASAPGLTGFLSAATTKVAAATVLAVAAGSVAVTHHAPHPRRTASPAPTRHATSVARPAHAPAPPKRRSAGPARQPRPSRPGRHPRPRIATRPSTTPASPSTGTAPAAPPASPTSASPSRSSATGGEFLLGGGEPSP